MTLNYGTPPTTAADFIALPIAGFGCEWSSSINSTVYLDPVPVMVLVVEANGEAWHLARHADGHWCRVETHHG